MVAAIPCRRRRLRGDLDVVELRMRSRGCSRDRELLRMSPEACAPDFGPRDLHVRHLPPALVARLLVAPARSGCISVILGALPSGGCQALQLGRAARGRRLGTATRPLPRQARTARRRTAAGILDDASPRPGTMVPRRAASRRRPSMGPEELATTSRGESSTKKSSTKREGAPARRFCTERSYFRSIESVDR